MSAARSKRTRTVEAEHRLLARIGSTKFSYSIFSRDSHLRDELIDDEAIIHIDAQISEIEPSQSQHLAQRLACSLVCARSFPDGAPQVIGKPLLLSVTLKKNARTILAYLPGDAFWAIQSRLESGTLALIEATYEKPVLGVGHLTALHFF
jgi:hypothetical protein